MVVRVIAAAMIAITLLGGTIAPSQPVEAKVVDYQCVAYYTNLFGRYPGFGVQVLMSKVYNHCVR